jgi:hypothetical protein
MSYIYGAPILDVSRSHTTTQHSRWGSSGRVISSSQRPLPDNTRHSQQTNIHAPGGIRTHRLCCVVVCDLETSRMGAPYMYDITRLSVKRDSVIAQFACTGSVPHLICSSFYSHYVVFAFGKTLGRCQTYFVKSMGHQNFYRCIKLCSSRYIDISVSGETFCLSVAVRKSCVARARK